MVISRTAFDRLQESIFHKTYDLDVRMVKLITAQDHPADEVQDIARERFTRLNEALENYDRTSTDDKKELVRSTLNREAVINLTGFDRFTPAKLDAIKAKLKSEAPESIKTLLMEGIGEIRQVNSQLDVVQRTSLMNMVKKTSHIKTVILEKITELEEAQAVVADEAPEVAPMPTASEFANLRRLEIVAEPERLYPAVDDAEETVLVKDFELINHEDAKPPAPVQAPAARKEAPAPVVRREVPAPVVRREVPAPVVRREVPAPVVRREVPAPVVRREASAPVVRREAPAPVVRREAPAPVIRREVPAPVRREPRVLSPKEKLQQDLTSLDRAGKEDVERLAIKHFGSIEEFGKNYFFYPHKPLIRDVSAYAKLAGISNEQKAAHALEKDFPNARYLLRSHLRYKIALLDSRRIYA